jgi:DNA-binding response OmpR family regulator
MESPIHAVDPPALSVLRSRPGGATAAQIPGRETDQTDHTQVSPRNVLIADDDDVSRVMLAAALTKLGYHVLETRDGGAALSAWEQGDYQLIISDCLMPDLDGLEFCRRIRAEKRANYTYLILLTSLSGKTNYLEAMNAGADDFITKPFEKDQLAARVRVGERILALHEDLRMANVDLEKRVRERTIQLEHALEAKGQFLSRASHQLRTPMNHILGFAQLLERGSITREQKENVQNILQSGGNLLQLIDRILEISSSRSSDLDFLETEPGSEKLTTNP